MRLPKGGICCRSLTLSASATMCFTQNVLFCPSFSFSPFILLCELDYSVSGTNQMVVQGENNQGHLHITVNQTVVPLLSTFAVQRPILPDSLWSMRHLIPQCLFRFSTDEDDDSDVRHGIGGGGASTDRFESPTNAHPDEPRSGERILSQSSLIVVRLFGLLVCFFISSWVVQGH